MIDTTWLRPLVGAILLLATAMLTAGCWDRSEVNELAIVLASGVDWEDNHWIVTAGIVQTAGRGGGEEAQTGPPGSAGRQAYVVSARGATLLEALANLALFTARRLRWDHVATLVIGEAAARHGILEILDLWTRQEALRMSAMVALVRGKALDFLVDAQTGLESRLGEELPGIIRLGNPLGISTTLSLHQLIRSLSGESHAAIVPLFGLVAQPQPPALGSSAPPSSQGDGGGGGSSQSGGGQPASSAQRSRTDPSSLVQEGRYLSPATPLNSVEVQGSGIIVGDKLVGYLTLYETRGVIWLAAPPRAATISVSCPGPSQTPEVGVIIEDTHISTKVSPAQIEITIRTTANMSGQSCLQNRESLMEGGHATGAEQELGVVAAEVAKHIEAEIRAALAATQPLGADVFRFGDLLHTQAPEEWRKVKNRWPGIYKTIPVRIKVEVRVVHTGLTISPPSVTMPGEGSGQTTGGRGSRSDQPEG